MTEVQQQLHALLDEGVSFIVIGGMAASIHGSVRATFDLDVVYERSRDNVERLVRALAPLHPYLRGAPPGLPFQWDRETILHGLNFTLMTDIGDLDLLGEIVGGGGYRELLPHAREVEAFGIRCRVLAIEKLIEVKRAAGRPKDFEAIAELELILERTEKK